MQENSRLHPASAYVSLLTYELYHNARRPNEVTRAKFVHAHDERGQNTCKAEMEKN